MKNLQVSFGVFMLLAISACTENTTNKHQGVMDLAVDWVTAGYTSQNAALSMVDANMADDGVSVGDRYVGFGFVWDPEGDGMVVNYVVPDSPAASVLMEGDSFVEVNGVRLTNDNRNSLGFRGKPGESVSAVIERDGAEMPISVARGPVQINYSKEQVMENISSGDADSWGPEEFNIIEVGATNEGVVHVLHWRSFIEDATGYNANAYTVTRFEFNENGEVTWVGTLSEDRFVLEQLGWTITR
tara:strand:- start:214 stop:942 length:729 start_codon:yes stop_codon:yes gene_type:complete